MIATGIMCVALVMLTISAGLWRRAALRYERDYQGLLRDRVLEEQIRAKEAAVERRVDEALTIKSGTFRRRAVMVDARQWDGSYANAMVLIEWIGHDRCGYIPASVPQQTDDIAPVVGSPAVFWLQHGESTWAIQPDWWIIKEPFADESQRFHAISPIDMRDDYELVEEG